MIAGPASSSSSWPGKTMRDTTMAAITLQLGTENLNQNLKVKVQVVSSKSQSGIENLKQNFQVEPNFQVLVNPDKQVPAAACVVATSRTVFLFIRVVFSFRLRLGTENLNLHFQVLIQVFSSKSQSVCSL